MPMTLAALALIDTENFSAKAYMVSNRNGNGRLRLRQPKSEADWAYRRKGYIPYAEPGRHRYDSRDTGCCQNAEDRAA
jgi:hypothetical protein